MFNLNEKLFFKYLYMLVKFCLSNSTFNYSIDQNSKMNVKEKKNIVLFSSKLRYKRKYCKKKKKKNQTFVFMHRCDCVYLYFAVSNLTVKDSRKKFIRL